MAYGGNLRRRGPSEFQSANRDNTGQTGEWEMCVGNHAQFFVRQHVEHMEALTGFETENSYDIFAPGAGQGGWAPWGQARESSGTCARQCLKNKRPFRLTLSDTQGRQVVHIHRPFTCCFSTVSVTDGTGAELGAVDQRCAMCHRHFDVAVAGYHTYDINGPLWRPWTFQIKDVGGGLEVGQIAKHWSGAVQEMMTDADDFGIQLPAGASPQAKAVLLAAVFLIDFCYFEEKGGMNNQNNRPTLNPLSMAMH